MSNDFVKEVARDVGQNTDRGDSEGTIGKSVVCDGGLSHCKSPFLEAARLDRNLRAPSV